ncbi:MAG: hypothetical protein ABSF08_12430 [Candidatus Cybelea sp.]
MRGFHLASGIPPQTATTLLAGCFAAAMFLSGCGGLPGALRQPFAPVQSDVARGAVALTVPHYAPLPAHRDRNRSSMSPNSLATKRLFYVGDDDTNDVYIYNYKSGKSLGTLTGFDGPYGMCVDGKGDIYIANFDAGNLVEYAHGGTTLLNTYESGGTPIGCSIGPNGDVAVTSFDPGEVTVYPGGNPSKGTTYSDSSCTYLWTMGYDRSGDLVGTSETSSGGRAYCALLSGSKSMTLLTTSGITINFPGGTSWDGKYIVLGDQEAGGTYQAGLARATLKGTTLTFVSETVLSDDCYNDYTDVVNPFFVGKTNTLFHGKQAKAVIGANLWCPDGGQGKVDWWHYPAGGLPYKKFASSSDPYGAAVSLGNSNTASYSKGRQR